MNKNKCGIKNIYFPQKTNINKINTTNKKKNKFLIKKGPTRFDLAPTYHHPYG